MFDDVSFRTPCRDGGGWEAYTPTDNGDKTGTDILGGKLPQISIRKKNLGHVVSRSRTIAPRRLAVAVGACFVVLLGVAVRLGAQPEEPSEIDREYTVKAAYLLQFGRYVEWPPSAFASSESPFVIGILGKDPFGRIFDEVARTKRIKGRPVMVRRFESMNDYKPCHILFISASAKPGEAAAAIAKLKTAPVLLVGEEPGFAERGGAINFVIEEDRIRFEVNAEATRREDLKISSTLLSFAKIVGRY